MIKVYEDLGESSRRSILGELRTGPKHVTDLVRATGLRQPNVSNHLARMKAGDVVRSEKVGRQVFYSLASPEVEDIVNAALANRAEPLASLDFSELSRVFARSATVSEETTCAEIIDLALRQRVPLLTIYERILTPAINLIGTWYKVEAIDEGHEHIATEIILRMMGRVVQATGFDRKTTKTALLGCAEGEWQSICLRMLSDYLKFCGWKAVFMGGNVPTPAFISAVKQYRPSLVLLTATTPEALEASIGLTRELADLRSKRLRYRIGVGGPVLLQNLDRITEAGADFAAQSLEDFAERCLPELEGSNRMG